MFQFLNLTLFDLYLLLIISSSEKNLKFYICVSVIYT